jgi:2-hydroxy-6-oxonona-2,4-dienedioate hydrolase
MKNEMNGWIEVEGTPHYYEIAGQGTPLVMLHAGFVDSRMWDPQWARLRERFRVVRFDLAGFGRSALPAGPLARRRELAGLLDRLGLAQATLLGCSLGGEIALDFCLEHAERVARLVLVSTAPGGFAMQGEPPADLLAMIAALQQGDLERASELQLRLWIDGPFRQHGQVEPSVRRRAAEMNRIPIANATWSRVDAQPLDPLAPPAAERLGELRVPTLILAGELDHPEILRAAAWMAERIPAARWATLTGCAHLPGLEKPEEFNHALAEFLG